MAFTYLLKKDLELFTTGIVVCLYKNPPQNMSKLDTPLASVLKACIL